MCAPGAICFYGKVSAGEEFRKSLNADLEFVPAPGWNITVVPTHPEGNCTELASVVNAPYRAHTHLDIDTSYGWAAEDEVSVSPRTFSFVRTCGDFPTESARLSIVPGAFSATAEEYEAAIAKLGTLATGTGRLWITDSKVSHALDTPEEKSCTIESMSFTVEIKLQAAPVKQR